MVIPNAITNAKILATLIKSDIAAGVPIVKALATAFGNLSSGVKIAILAAAVFAVIKVFDLLANSTERAIEKHDELAAKYRETAAEFKTLSDELLEVQNRLKELNEIDDPSMVDPEELEELKATEESLLRQIKYKEKLKDYEQGQAADAAYAALTNDPVFGDDMLTNVRNLQSLLETFKQLEANAYDKIATLTPGSARFNSTEAEIKKFASEIENVEADIASSMLELDSLYSSLVDDQGNAIRADHGNMVAELKLLLELDDESAEQAAQDAGDVAGQVSNMISEATKEAFSSEAQEALDESVNNFQSALSTLSSALEDLRSGSLGVSDIVDLMQEFPELAPYIDITADGFGNLEAGLQDLIKASPDSVISTLQKFKETYTLTENQVLMIDSLCSAFQSISDKALKADASAEDYISTLEKFETSYKVVRAAQDEMAAGTGLSAETIKALASVTEDYINYLYEENGVVKLNVDAWKEYLNAKFNAKSADMVTQVEDEIVRLQKERDEIERTQDSLYEKVKAVHALAEAYNAITNGNVDYAKRPFVSPEDMRTVYPDFDGDVATTYSSTHTIGEGELLYTLEVTPILEDGTVLDEDTLSDYITNLVTDDGIEGLLASDTDNLILNVVPGDYDVAYWDAYQQKIGDVKNKHWELVKQLQSETGLSWPEIEIEFAKIAAELDKNQQAIASNQSQLDVYNALYSKITGSVDGYTSALNHFSNVKDKIALVSDSLKTVADLQAEVANGFTMSLDKALEFAAVYPEILNGATVSADGQISLNEDVVNSFISGKEAEMKSQIDEQIAALEADKATLVAKKEFAEAQLKLAQSVSEGEGQISEDVAEYRVRAGNAVAEALVNAGVQEADAYRLACAAMAGNAEEFNSIAAAVCTDVQGNFNSAAYAAAQAIYRNMNRAKTDIASLASQAQDAARAIAGMSRGSVAGSSSVRGGSGGGVYSGGGRITQRKWQFDGVDFQYDPVLFELEDFISQLELDISEYEDAIAQIDGQIAVLKALRERDLGSYKSDRTSGSGGNGGGSSRGNSDADNAIADAEDALRDEFKDYLNDMEHLISLMERNNVPDAEIIDAYKRMMEAIHAEAERARANGEDENSDYIQELQDQWWEYHDAIQEIRDDITEGAKSAVEELVGYRIDMLKQELEDEKDALDERLDQLKEFYDEQKEMLRDQYDEEKYLKEQAEKRKAVSDIEAELEGLKYDDSAWAQKRRAELEAELADARKELEDFEKENALSEVEKLLDEQYEKQAALIQAQIDAIEEKLNDPNALYNQALNDIKNSTEALYQEMIAYNNAHGDGNADTIRAFWEECFAALKDYEDLFGESFEGVNMDNATGYDPGHGGVDVGGGSSTPVTGGDTGSTKPDTGSSGSTPAPVAPALEKGSRVQVKDGVKWYADSNGGGKWGYAKSGTIKYVNKKGSHPYNIDGAGWVRKKDIVGYASGTANATPGLHQIYENGEEFIFESPSDGSKYRIFRGGEKVLDAKATNFLYNFANTQGGTLKDRWSSLVNSVMQRFVIGSGNGAAVPQIVMGDIIVQGNASDRTLSEIRRAQREHTADLLKEFKKLSRG